MRLARMLVDSGNTIAPETLADSEVKLKSLL
jgi:hypothetical protein